MDISKDIVSTELNLSTEKSIDTPNPSSKLTTTDRSNEITIPSTYHAYHYSEIHQNDTIIKTAKGIIWAGFVLIGIGVVFALFEKIQVTLVASISGIITEIISAVVFCFVNQSSKSKLQYFHQLSLDEEGNKIIRVIETLGAEAKEKLIEKLVDNYCERRKSND